MQSTESAMRQAAPYLMLGTQLGMTVLVLGGIGWWIDSIASSGPLALVIGLVLGSIVGLVQFLRAVTRLGARDKAGVPLDRNEQET